MWTFLVISIATVGPLILYVQKPKIVQNKEKQEMFKLRSHIRGESNRSLKFKKCPLNGGARGARRRQFS